MKRKKNPKSLKITKRGEKKFTASTKQPNGRGEKLSKGGGVVVGGGGGGGGGR